MDNEMKFLSDKIVNQIFKKYDIIYNRENKIINVKKDIKVVDFIRLKEVLKVIGIEISDIRVGEGVYEKM